MRRSNAGGRHGIPRPADRTPAVGVMRADRAGRWKRITPTDHGTGAGGRAVPCGWV